MSQRTNDNLLHWDLRPFGQADTLTSGCKRYRKVLESSGTDNSTDRVSSDQENMKQRSNGLLKTSA